MFQTIDESKTTTQIIHTNIRPLAFSRFKQRMKIYTSAEKRVPVKPSPSVLEKLLLLLLVRTSHRHVTIAHAMLLVCIMFNTCEKSSELFCD